MGMGITSATRPKLLPGNTTVDNDGSDTFTVTHLIPIGQVLIGASPEDFDTIVEVDTTDNAVYFGGAWIYAFTYFDPSYTYTYTGTTPATMTISW